MWGMARNSSDPTSSTKTMASVRVDKWLWAARCFKTRSASGEACDGGHVKINGQTVKPSRPVKPDDVVDVLTAGGRKVLKVVALADRRGSAEIAQSLYEDLTPPEPVRPYVPKVLRERGMGRPTKRERRQMDKVKTW